MLSCFRIFTLFIRSQFHSKKKISFILNVQCYKFIILNLKKIAYSGIVFIYQIKQVKTKNFCIKKSDLAATSYSCDHKALHFLHCQIRIDSAEPTYLPFILLGIVVLLQNLHNSARAISTSLLIN